MISSNVYEEVYQILKYMDKMTVMKIPQDILNNIITRRNIDFVTKIDKNDIFNEENASKEAIDILCWIDYNYWMDENKKREIDKICREKNIKSEIEKRERYNPDNIFKNKPIDMELAEQETQTVQMIEYKEQKWYQKIFAKILKIFKTH